MGLDDPYIMIIMLHHPGPTTSRKIAWSSPSGESEGKKQDTFTNSWPNMVIVGQKTWPMDSHGTTWAAKTVAGWGSFLEFNKVVPPR